ncbi:energy-coupling factor transporter transmembrane component T [Sporomusa termitida]|uniref:Energy-coupling factor transporter transmembrane protein EcfT n=1 Tax=Sporomusa termitida TaxID=2377 RepID=A0A517DRH6_9FIRM|nr:energy-coupling factor transporter transmembrane component T [Sporomusa termitida]QDR79886.1 Energy-coupling factor transporter transmembrane protein EcfT [Sporomusa termitida]
MAGKATLQVQDLIALGVLNAVFLRFLPRVKEELGHIKNPIKMRNIELTGRGLLFQPVRTMESILVLQLMGSVKVADELAAALTRGIDGERPRTSRRAGRTLFADVVLAAGFTLFAAVLWYLDKNMFSGLSLGGWARD